MQDLTITMPVKGNRLSPSDQDQAAIRGFLKSFEGKPVMVKFCKPRRERSHRQNRFYWGVVLTLIAQHTGHTTEEIHEWLKDDFLPRRFVKIGNKEKEFRKTTTELTTQEFEEYLERVRAWAAQELGVMIPLPGE